MGCLGVLNGGFIIVCAAECLGNSIEMVVLFDDAYRSMSSFNNAFIKKRRYAIATMITVCAVIITQ